MKEKLILELYKQIWSGVRTNTPNYIQYLVAVISILVVLKFGLDSKNNQILFLAVIISQYALIWVLLLIIEFAYKYRIEGQGLSIAIENAVFGINFGDEVVYNNKVVLPKTFRKIEHLELQEIHQLYFFILFLFFSLLSFASLQFVYNERIEFFCFADVASICGSLTIVFLIFYYLIQKLCVCRKLKCELICNKCNKTLIFLLFIVTPWLIMFVFKFLPLTKKLLIILNWFFGVILIFVFYCYRNKKLKDFISQIK